METDKVNPGLSERVLKEVIATPAFKELLLLQMKDIKAETAPGLVKTLLWGDPGISMSLFGALPDAVNWLMELLLELGRQLNGLPEPLLKDMLGQIGKGIDSERLRQFPVLYSQLAGRLLFGDDATPEEKRAAVVAAVNSLLAGMDKLTMELERNRKEVSRSLSQGIQELDKAALARSLRRIGMLAVAAARGPQEKAGGRVPKAAVLAGGIAALMALRLAIRKVRGR